ncbi:alpha/beta fold hydrolase [Candidatus Woesearchaeota archaeon]|nr:alpha/beta fold hydrolase [Candidatus Woesearchaeota archaeon]
MLKKEDDNGFEQQIRELAALAALHRKGRSEEQYRNPADFGTRDKVSLYRKGFLAYVDIYLKIYSSGLDNNAKTELLIKLQDAFYELKGLPRIRRRHVGIKDIEHEIIESIQKERSGKLRKLGEQALNVQYVPDIRQRQERYKAILAVLVGVIMLASLASFSYYNYAYFASGQQEKVRPIAGNLSGVLIKPEQQIRIAPVIKTRIAGVAWLEDTSGALELDRYFYDANNEPLTYMIKGLQHITAAIDARHTAIFTPAENWHGTETAVIEASDGTYTAVSNEFNLTVLPTADCSLDGCEPGEDAANCPLDCPLPSRPNGSIILQEASDETPDIPYNSQTGQPTGRTEQQKMQQASAKPKEYQAPTSVLFGMAPQVRITESMKYSLGNASTIDLQTINPNPIPCVVTTRTDRAEPFIFNISREDEGKKEHYSGSGIIPEGYEIIIPPFNVNCRQEELQFTITVPTSYIDVKALKCSKANCSEQNAVEVTELRCGNEMAKEVSRKELFYQPRFVEVNITTLNFSSFEDVLKQGKNTVKFSGDKFQGLTASIIFPEERIPQPPNPSSVILNTFVLRLENFEGSLDSIITMPYTVPENIDEQSLGMYFRHNNSWKYFGGEIDAGQKIMTGNLSDVSSLLDARGELMVAVIGSVCINCLRTDFKQVYNPVIRSRDAIILVHGIASSPATYQELIDDFKLTRQPWQVWTFGYPSYRGVEENAAELAEFLQANSDKYDTFYVVAHSAGGLIAQRALHDSYMLNANDSSKHGYVRRARKMILIATPNNGTPVAGFYYNLINFVVNSRNLYNSFKPGHALTGAMLQGLATPRVPWVQYYVIAGTRPYEIDAIFAKLSSSSFFGDEENDGIVGVKSAQLVGDAPLGEHCVNYWSLNVTHTELIDDFLARKLIEQLIAKEVNSALGDMPMPGFNAYYEIKAGCDAGDKFIVIGRKISREKAYDPFACSCGNGACGIGETERNCPKDCTGFRLQLDKRLILFILLGLLAALFIVSRIMGRKYVTSEEKKPVKRLSFEVWSRKKIKQEQVKPVRKVTEIPQGYQTDIDLLYRMLAEKKKLKLSQVSANFGISKVQAEEWARILEDNKLAKIHYPLLGDAEIILLE